MERRNFIKSVFGGLAGFFGLGLLKKSDNVSRETGLQGSCVGRHYDAVLMDDVIPGSERMVAYMYYAVTDAKGNVTGWKTREIDFDEFHINPEICQGEQTCP